MLRYADCLSTYFYISLCCYVRREGGLLDGRTERVDAIEARGSALSRSSLAVNTVSRFPVSFLSSARCVSLPPVINYIPNTSFFSSNPKLLQ